MGYSRDNTGKPPLHHLLYFSNALAEVTKTCEFGQMKYSKHNWLKGGSYASVVDSLLRHLFKRASGDIHDEESKVSHLAHVVWNALALLEWELQGLGEDDLTVTKQVGDVTKEDGEEWNVDYNKPPETNWYDEFSNLNEEINKSLSEQEIIDAAKTGGLPGWPDKAYFDLVGDLVGDLSGPEWDDNEYWKDWEEPQLDPEAKAIEIKNVEKDITNKLSELERRKKSVDALIMSSRETDELEYLNEIERNRLTALQKENIIEKRKQARVEELAKETNTWDAYMRVYGHEEYLMDRKYSDEDIGNMRIQLEE